MEALELRILGPLEVLRAGAPLPFARGKERALLALLLVNRNGVVPVDEIVHELWAGAPPRTAQTALHGYVGKLRKLLGSDRLLTRGSGYLLRVEPGELDAERFEELVAEGRSSEALALWRARALDDVQDQAFAQAEIRRLSELRAVALEQSLQAMVEGGRPVEAVSQLEQLVREQPYRERPRALLMLALYRAGRQADALAVCRELRRTFADELGLEPSAEVRQLEQRILAQDPSLADAAPSRTEPTTPAREARRGATVVHCRLVVSAERLDPERLQSNLERFVDSCSAVIERRGGTVASISRNGVVGIFGFDRTREDDALRAVQAARCPTSPGRRRRSRSRSGTRRGRRSAPRSCRRCPAS